jgi:hypothetical protein
MPEFIDVDPGNLHLPPSLAQGAEPGKLARQIARYGKSLDGMLPLQVIRGKDGHLSDQRGCVPGDSRREAPTRCACARRSHPSLAATRCDPYAESKGPSALNSQERAELLATIAELSQRYPDWRLGQLVANVAGWADQEIWDIEDEQLLEAARVHMQQLTRVQATPIG